MVVYIQSVGGFGNLLFLYILGYTIHKKYDVLVEYIDEYGHHRPQMSTYPLFTTRVKVHHHTFRPENCIRIKEVGHPYTPWCIPNVSVNYLISGYYQSYKYTSPELLTSLRDILFPQIHPIINNCTPTVLLHVRRGDSIGNEQVHPIQSDKYYIEALKIIAERLPEFKVLVFSDDIPFVSEWSVLNGYPYTIMDISDTVECFNYMRRCNHFIIANSTYSLLSYYFRTAQDAIVCVPAKWFGPAGPKFNIDDIVPPSDKRFILDL